METNMDNDQDHVRTRAYQIWEAAGRPEGEHDNHWHQANAELGLSDAREPDRAAASIEADKTSDAPSSAASLKKRGDRRG
jgi:hypothetical protein